MTSQFLAGKLAGRFLPDLGLEVYMLGLDKLSSASATPASPAKP
jgi:hypothetical protein